VNSYRSIDPPWANAQNTPFTLYKRYNHEGGIATPFIAHWPDVIGSNTMTGQMAHVIDVMATVLDITGADYPTVYRDDNVTPYEGASLIPLLRGEDKPIHDTLYWQFSGSRAMREGPWKLVGAPNESWTLFNLETDRTEQNNLAGAYPDRVERMKSMWDAWAIHVGAKR
jgi:arylsulfatase